MRERKAAGVRTRVLLLASLILVVAGSTSASLFIIRNRLRQQARAEFSSDLSRSVAVFQKLQSQRLASLHRANALLADLPSLKALMTTSDPRTVADGSIAFWKTSGNDLLALADRDFRLLAFNARSVSPELQQTLQGQVGDASRHFLLGGSSLYEYSVQPIYFGDRISGTLLGYVVSGYSIDRALLQDVAQGAGSDAAFFAGDQLMASSLPASTAELLGGSFRKFASASEPVPLHLGGERYLAITQHVDTGEPTPLRLVVLKSFARTEMAEKQINRLIGLAGVIAIAVGAVLMLWLSRMLTRPLEKLANGVRAFGSGDRAFSLPASGTQEVQYLSSVFAQMRDQIQETNSKLLESERLATIGRMANSVSHDLRHYLAAVYANAEFLASPNLSPAERQELYEEIRLAVQGTTEMLDSLLIFGRSGTTIQRSASPVLSIVERAISLVRSHPDSDGVTVVLENKAEDTVAMVDFRQVERAIYNLLLNACQSARESPEVRRVVVTLTADNTKISASIVDSGLGVPDAIRDNLFQPFVSQGRHKGTGLGLTLASSVAQEHQGEVRLMDARPGSTTFVLTIARNTSPQATAPESNRTVLTP